MSLWYVLEENERDILIVWTWCEKSLVGGEQKFCFRMLFFFYSLFLNSPKLIRVKFLTRDYEVK